MQGYLQYTKRNISGQNYLFFQKILIYVLLKAHFKNIQGVSYRYTKSIDYYILSGIKWHVYLF